MGFTPFQLRRKGVDPRSQMILDKPPLRVSGDLQRLLPPLRHGVCLLYGQETHELKLQADMVFTMRVADGGVQSERLVETGNIGEARRSTQETPGIAIGGLV